MKIRNRLAPTGLALLAVFMVIMVWANYNSQLELRDASLKQFRAGAEREATSITHFFSERSNNLEDLSNSRELLAYYENKALGMSKEYGLWASLIGISELFRRFVEDKELDGVPIFERIGYVDISDGLLADNTEAVDGADTGSVPDVPKAVCRPNQPCVFFKVEKGDVDLVMTQPFFFKKKPVGFILARVNKGVLSLLFGQNHHQSSGLDFLVCQNRIYSPLSPTPEALMDMLRRGNLPDRGETLAAKFSIKKGAPEEYLLTSADIDGTPFKLLHLTLEHTVFGALSPWQLLVFSVLLAALLLGGGGAILWMNARNLVLRVKVDESFKHAKQMEAQNKELEREVAARREAEAALTLMNEELEERVRKRTGDLNEQAETLRREVTERREAEATLRTVFNNTNDAIIIHDMDGNIIEANDRMFDLYQISRDELGLFSAAEDLACSEAEIQSLQDKWERALDGELVPSFEYVAKRFGDGSCFNAEAATCRIELGGRTVILTSIHDISAQKKVLIQQAEHQVFLSTVFEGIGAAIFVFDPEKRRIVDCNSVGEKMLSLSKDEILSRSCRTPYPLDDQGTDLLCPDRHDEGGYNEYTLSLPGKEPFPISRRIFEISIGEHAHLVQVVLDITERKTLERKLNMARKLESIGQLAAGIAHEINTPIQFVGDSVRFVRNAFDDISELVDGYEKVLGHVSETEEAGRLRDNVLEFKEDMGFEFVMEEAPKACDDALVGVDRVATIVSAMKKFAHPGEEYVEAVNINEAIENTITVARNEWKYVAEIETSFEPDLPPVFCYPGSINQVLLNLIVNAAHASGPISDQNKKGLITISTSHRQGTVEISISDTGCGIPAEHLSRIYDPFFTTKEVGKGTGQGLAIAHDIVVHKHGGNIEVESEVGKGTTFKISLPVRPADASTSD